MVYRTPKQHTPDCGVGSTIVNAVERCEQSETLASHMTYVPHVVPIVSRKAATVWVRLLKATYLPCSAPEGLIQFM
jgi:hypothetical protein